MHAFMSSWMIALHLSVCRLTDTEIGYEHAAFLHGGCLLFAISNLQLATLEKIILRITCTPKFKMILWRKKCVLYPRFDRSCPQLQCVKSTN